MLKRDPLWQHKYCNRPSRIDSYVWPHYYFGSHKIISNLKGIICKIRQHVQCNYLWFCLLKWTCIWIFKTQYQIKGHYTDVLMGALASQSTSLMVVYWTVYSDADPRKHQSSMSLAFVRGIHRSPVNSPHKWPVTRKNVSIWWRHHGK